MSNLGREKAQLKPLTPFTANCKYRRFKGILRQNNKKKIK
jgi:hypothetical protein